MPHMKVFFRKWLSQENFQMCHRLNSSGSHCSSSLVQCPTENILCKSICRQFSRSISWLEQNTKPPSQSIIWL